MKILLVDGRILWIEKAKDYRIVNGMLVCFDGVDGRPRTKEIIRINERYYITWWYDNEEVSLQSEAQQ